MRIVVLGGAGNFGARIVRVLSRDPDVELIAAGRRVQRVSGAEQVQTLAMDIDSPDFSAQLTAAQPGLVIHCVGPFQGQDYRVARAALNTGAHYVDLADGRGFVADFVAANDARARDMGRCAITGASTLPALSTAVLDDLCSDGFQPEAIEIAIAPGQRAPRGPATLAAVFSYLGRPLSVWEQGRWTQRWGWMSLRRVRLAFGTRWAALCDVPDLALLPGRYPGLQSAHFHAALEFGLQHFALWSLAAVRRIGLPLRPEKCAVAMNRVAGLFDRFGGEWGGMRIAATGKGTGGRRWLREWQLQVPATNGPEIPCMAAILLTRRLVRGYTPPAGAAVCMGFLRLQDFLPLFDHWGILTRTEEMPA
jgi:saccharopine dehydrogenase-like NADP-dependent oxidoreductase